MKVAFVSRQCGRSNSLFAKSNLGPRPLPVTGESEMLSFCSSSNNSVFAGGVQVDEKASPGDKPPETEPCSIPSF